MKSMTGFGKGESVCAVTGIRFGIEISAVNRKQTDIRMNLPREMSALEPELRRLITARISRGAIAVKATLQYEGKVAAEMVRINEDLAAYLANKCLELGNRLHLNGKIELRDILAIPGVVEPTAPDLETPENSSAFTAAAEMALNRMDIMREAEGNSIRHDLSGRLTKLRKLTDAIEPLTAALPEEQKERLLRRIADAGLGFSPDDERILREAVIFADRLDVAEEITRLRSHFAQFEKFISSDEGAPGRSLDFLSQEIAREINTLGNKAACAAVSPLTVIFKTELEKIREQVQNIE